MSGADKRTKLLEMIQSPVSMITMRDFSQHYILLKDIVVFQRRGLVEVLGNEGIRRSGRQESDGA